MAGCEAGTVQATSHGSQNNATQLKSRWVTIDV